jgi:hypothetical protein
MVFNMTEDGVPDMTARKADGGVLERCRSVECLYSVSPIDLECDISSFWKNIIDQTGH